MIDKLNEIMAWKRQEVAAYAHPVSESSLASLDQHLPRPPSFALALRRSDGKSAIIAEIKRRSPSAGDIRAGASALQQAECYRNAGADALSILTDARYFGGSLEDLRSVTAHFASKTPALPCLRKDFFVHPVQVLHAREAGASAILIIVRALTDDEIRLLSDCAQAAGLDALFEIHDEADLERALAFKASLIGVNNRDLAVFTTDLRLSERLLPRFPKHVTAVSESGIHSPHEAGRARRAGAHALLVGEALMRAQDTSALMRALQNA